MASRYVGGGGGLPVTAGLVAWYAADQISGLSNGDPVATWQDASGQGHDASQGTQSKQPTWVRDWRNGAAAVRFDGVDDELTAAAFAVSQPNTWYLVGQYHVANKPQFLVDSSPARQVVGITNNGSFILQFYAGTALLSPASMDTDPFILRAQFAGAASEGAQNGTIIVSGNAGANNSSGLFLGCSNVPGSFSDVWLAQIISYNRALSSQEITALDHYFSSYYNIVVSD